MKTKQLTAVIEKGEDNNYSIYLPQITGLYGTGETEEEAKAELLEAISSAKEYAEEENDWSEYKLLKNDFNIEYKYDLSGFFKTYDFFDVSALANYIGLNASMLRRYKTGKSKASDKTKQKVEMGIHSIAQQLSIAHF